MRTPLFRPWREPSILAALALPALLLISPLAAAVGQQPKVEQGPAARLSEAPPRVRQLRNPFAGNEKATAAGGKLFKQHCAECHGDAGQGLGHAANLHSRGVQAASDGALFWAVKNGRIRRGMPSWSQLPDQEVWQIVSFMKTLKPK